MELGLLKVTGEVRLAESVRMPVRQSEELKLLTKPFPRKIELVPLTEVVDQAMRSVVERPSDRTASDVWLGPRLHAALRLTRSEAASDEVWHFLAGYAFPDYVRWRWPDPRAVENRTFSSDVKKQAFKRLWWTTELFRDGSDYATAEFALSESDIPNTLTGIDAIHSRPVALGVLEFVKQHSVKSRQIVSLTKQLDSSAVTVALDRSFISQDEAVEVDEAWLSEEPDLQDLMKNPVGPRSGKVDRSEVARVYDALNKIIDLEILRRPRKAERDVETSF